MEILRDKKTGKVDAGWFKYQLQRIKTYQKFMLYESLEDLNEMLTECLKNETERRGRLFLEDEPTKDKVKVLCSWLTCSSGKCGVVLSGNVGSGKTTMMESVRTLINILKPSESSFNPRTMFITARELNYLSMGEKEERIEKLKRVECLFLDDLGCESTNVKVYGNVVSPITELLYTRYERRAMTMITTNMQKKEIKQRYGERIADRMNEIFGWIGYTNKSYRSN